MSGITKFRISKRKRYSHKTGHKEKNIGYKEKCRW